MTTDSLTTVYTCPDGTPFPVEWPDEESRKSGWRWDQMHNPLPVTPLVDDIQDDWRQGFAKGMDVVGLPGYPVNILVHGFRFMRTVRFDDDPVVRRGVNERYRALHAHRLLELWKDEYLPECEALTRSQLTWDNPRWNLRQAVEHFSEVRAARRRLGEVHTYAMQLTQDHANALIAFCAKEFGGDGEILAGELTTGYANRSLDSAQALWELSRLAENLPAVAELLHMKAPGEVQGSLETVPGGLEFRAALDAFLAEYGHRTEAFTELALPRWLDDPRFPLLMVRRYMEMDESASPANTHAVQAARREERMAECLRTLRDPAVQDEFRRLRELAAERTILIEDHNFAIDQKGISAGRVPCLALGRRLVEQSAIADVEDVFYLRLSEIEDAATTTQDYRPTVAARRAERARWMRVLPPTYIGDAPATVNPAQDTFFGKFKTEPDPPGIVIGIAGSPGVIRGTARFIGDLGDADRLEPGEILLTYSTAPPWTPLFAIAGGIVTDSGGVVSHCAVVAREYGIPAVVGTRNGTATIKDGMTITVDGTAGTVTLEP